MTPNKEDYLKIIYECSDDGKLAPNKAIAEGLGVTPSSVTEMLSKLKAEGLIEYQAYKGSRLTETGLRDCLGVVRSHELWEVFLIQHLGYSWSEAHEDAHLLEHAAPSRMVDRLDRFLGHPKFCPHGSAIPQEGLIPVTGELRPLSALVAGDSAVLRKVFEEKELLDYLQGLGLSIGARLEVLKIGSYNGPVTISIEGRVLPINHRATEQIFVSEH